MHNSERNRGTKTIFGYLGTGNIRKKCVFFFGGGGGLGGGWGVNTPIHFRGTKEQENPCMPKTL